MEGYHLSVMNSFYALTSFKNFSGGELDPEKGGRPMLGKRQTSINYGL